ncbi:polysaccharide pyruvyl transferase family protein [Pseudoclavibacter helvolus]|uniref:polysaccharide pyruvyl transferase family protein n=1 Tax=Pseudoclavibacter helvolus TaxID=255205 RepID=UPI00083867DE|nr:polysaccharide pyruvyl transferase family protein [Pseudoclavibacter helvolus]
MVDVVSIGAYDRFNYGDLMFPLVLDFAGRELGYPPMTHAATRKSDLRHQGAVPTVSISDFYAARRPTEAARSFILGGGEVVGATWGQAAASLLPVPLDYGLLAVRKFISEGAFDSVGRSLLRGQWPTPYVPEVSSKQGDRLVTNAIGASSLKHLTPVLRECVTGAIRQASFASVRDTEGQAALAGYDVNAELAPDSVAILERMHPVTREAQPRTLVVQCSRTWYASNSVDFSSSVLELASQFDRVELLPIGIAGAHGDGIALSRLEKHLNSAGVSNVRIVPVATVWDVADSIAKADLFIGTSLHGAITSLAYSVPFIPLAGISKLEAYLATWGQSIDVSCAPGDELVSAAAQVLAVDPGARQELSQSLAATSWANTERVLSAANAA